MVTVIIMCPVCLVYRILNAPAILSHQFESLEGCETEFSKKGSCINLSFAARKTKWLVTFC